MGLSAFNRLRREKAKEQLKAKVLEVKEPKQEPKKEVRKPTKKR